MKAISLDVWNTLITPNPAFAVRRKDLLAEAFGIDADIVSAAYTKTKQSVDTAAECSGLVYTNVQVYTKLFDLLQVDVNTFDRFDLIHSVNSLFLKYPPMVSSAIKTAVQQASSVVRVGIASNSNFISGAVMHPWLQQEFGMVFDFGVYSDVVGCAKPNPDFFNLVARRAAVSDGVLHVGDNVVCDGGATACGFDFKLATDSDAVVAAIKEWCDGN